MTGIQTNLSKILRGNLDFSQKQKEGLNTYLFVFLIAVSIVLRFFHFGELIDEPHSWRQCDTANYIWDFYKNGIDLFHPSVCWMGSYKTVLFEFPLPEALCAFLYDLFGPYHVVARAFFLFFFLLGVYYFYKILLVYLNRLTAQIAVLIYTVLPLSLFYSRAVHIDFFALCFAFAMFYYYSLGIRDKNWKHIFIGSLFATICFLVKAPYAFSFVIPLLYIISTEGRWKFCFRYSLLFIFPIIFFLFWLYKSNEINSQAPDWTYIPNYHRFNDNFNWYFGKLEHRFIARSWTTLIHRFLYDVSGGFIGLTLVVIGLISSFYYKTNPVFKLWFLGSLVYFFIFFNLNVIHNYYQIPFLPVVSVFISIACVKIVEQFKIGKLLIVSLLLIGVFYQSIIFAEKEYFKIDEEQHIIGDYISKNTSEQDLVLVSVNGLSVHCPNILYRAKRNGWSVPIADINGKIVFNLMKEGCALFVIIGDTLPSEDLKKVYDYFYSTTIPMKNGKNLYLINFKKTADGKVYRLSDYL
jgi:4-amino-4-deoxy-L-arabinose transferase-like glycosyltransferase